MFWKVGVMTVRRVKTLSYKTVVETSCLVGDSKVTVVTVVTVRNNKTIYFTECP